MLFFMTHYSTTSKDETIFQDLKYRGHISSKGSRNSEALMFPCYEDQQKMFPNPIHRVCNRFTSPITHDCATRCVKFNIFLFMERRFLSDFIEIRQEV